jgi:hypothetical protein
VNAAKYERCAKAFGVLRQKLEEARPDVLVICGDDQREQFDFSNFPAFALYVGSEFEGYKTTSYPVREGRQVRAEKKPHTPEHWVRVKGHAKLGEDLLVGLMRRGFDPAFCLELPKKEEGMGHAFMRPTYSLTPRYDIPIIPVMVNCYFAPQPTAVRCYQLGRALRAIIEESPLNLNVVVLGSGGLWHTPGARDAYLDETFDQEMLNGVRSGNIKRMAEYFDQTKPPASLAGDGERRAGDTGLGLPGGMGSGTGETRNWIIAAGAADGVPGTVVDYVPVYASPCGMGFAYWERV